MSPANSLVRLTHNITDSVRSRSAFLYTAVLCVASLHNQNQIIIPIYNSEESNVLAGNVSGGTDRVFLQPYAHEQISILAVNHATAVFVDGHSTLEVVQAFYLLSTWKEPDDSISYLRIGYATKLAMDLDLSRREPHQSNHSLNEDTRKQKDHWWRSRQRMWLLLFVQVNRSCQIRVLTALRIASKGFNTSMPSCFL